MKDIYRITNIINGKCYVGQTKQGILKRLHQHSKTDSLIGRAIRKYGVHNFIIEILYTVSDDKANEYENMCIIENNCVAPNGYNTNEYGRLLGECKTKYRILCYNVLGYNALMNCSSIFAWYVLKMFKFVSKKYLIMKNRKTPITKWFDLYKLLEMTSKDTQTKFKKEMTENEIIIPDKNGFKINSSLFTLNYGI